MDFNKIMAAENLRDTPEDLVRQEYERTLTEARERVASLSPADKQSFVQYGREHDELRVQRRYFELSSTEFFSETAREVFFESRINTAVFIALNDIVRNYSPLCWSQSNVSSTDAKPLTPAQISSQRAAKQRELADYDRHNEAEARKREQNGGIGYIDPSI